MAQATREEEVEELRRRLSEAEETLRAISQGAVDALVVRGPEGPQIFTLRGAQEPYRILVERMSEGALTCSVDGTILYSNRHFADLLGQPLEAIVGRPLAAFVPDCDQVGLKALVDDGAQRSLRRELAFRRGDGSIMPALVSVGLLALDDVSAVLLIVTDLTAQRHSEEIAAAERFSRSILEQAADAVMVFDARGSISQASWAAERLLGGGLIGNHVADVLPLAIEAGLPGPRLGSTKALVRAVLGGTSQHGMEARVSRPGLRDQHFLLSVGPLHDPDRRTIGGIFTLTDITERKQAEEQQMMLVAELNHRVKNILAIVQSVAWQTLSGKTSLSGFKDTFGGRLKAIALAHDILTQTRWGRVDLAHLLAQSLAPYRAGEAQERIELSGPQVAVPAQMVVPLSMVLHELCTNAAKYGAFADEEGRLAVKWRVADDGRTVHLDWLERNAVKLPKEAKPGFGSKLITRVMSYDLKGRADMRLRPEGMHCALAFTVALGDADRETADATAGRER